MTKAFDPTLSCRPAVIAAIVGGLPRLALTTVLVLAPVALPAGAEGLRLPPPPPGLGHIDRAPPPDGVIAYVDAGATNKRGDACHATVSTNAGVRVLSGFLDLWTPRTPFVDADQEAPAKEGCPAVAKSDWDGIPGSATDGQKRRSALHRQNLAYSIRITRAQTPALDLAAYLDDRRNKNVSITDGLGPLAEAWRKGTRQTTTITTMPDDATRVKYEDEGNNRGIGAKDNPDLGKAVDLLEAGSADGSTEPAKRFYKYARPYRASAEVRVVPQLEPAKNGKPAADGGFPSGHTAEAWRDALVMAYLVPQRYQEMLTRAALMGENRIRAGMHQTFDVLGGRVLATATVAYNLNRTETAGLKIEAFQQSQAWLMRETGAEDGKRLLTLAKQAPKAVDPFADAAANRRFFAARLTYSYPQIGDPHLPPRVPKGAEVLLETRLPYLTAEQRRVVLKTTEIASGYPILNDAEGWGRLDLYRAADGYGAFDGDVTVRMDADKGGFNAEDSWNNAISGAGLLTKQGSGTLALTGRNRWTGGTVLDGGQLVTRSSTALGRGDVYLRTGTLAVESPGATARPLLIAGRLSVEPSARLILSARSDRQPSLRIDKTLAIAGGTLTVDPTVTRGLRPGNRITLIQAGRIEGRFDHVTLEGHRIRVAYGSRTLSIVIEEPDAG